MKSYELDTHNLYSFRKRVYWIAETLNLLYQLTNKKQRVKVVKEVVERSDLSPEVTVNTETVWKAMS